MPPLLQNLTERKPENLDYLGVSYGLTPQLLRYAVSFPRGIFVLIFEQILETSRICHSLCPTNH